MLHSHNIISFNASIKMTNIKQCALKITKQALIISGCIITPPSYMELMNWSSTFIYKYDAISQGDESGTKDASLISHRMIDFDLETGVISPANAALAYGNTQHFLRDVKNKCLPPDPLTTLQYLSCANTVLGAHFYYKPSAPVSIAWMNHYSDCDLNVYLLFDALNLAGIVADIVYAPGHAFIHITDKKTKSSYFWETTARHNTGNLASLSDKYLYEKNKNEFYYSPKPSLFAEHLYPMLTLDTHNRKNRSESLAKLMSEFPDNPMVLDYWYEDKESLSITDINNIKKLLTTDITSTDKRIILARHYQKNGDPDTAKTYLSQIDDRKCNSECLSLKGNINAHYKITSGFDSTLKTIGFTLSPEERDLSMDMSIIFYTLITFWLLLSKRAVSIVSWLLRRIRQERQE